MLTGLRIENFKSWKDTGQIRFAPLTGFFGANSSGKTALLQMLLLLKQTVESNDRSIILHTGDEKSYVDVGTVYDVIHKKQIPGQISVELDWKLEIWESLVPDSFFPDYLNSISPLDFANFKVVFDISAENFFLNKFNYTVISEEGEYNAFLIPMWSEETYNNFITHSLGMRMKSEQNYELSSNNFRVPDEKHLALLQKSAKSNIMPYKFYGFSDEKNLGILSSWTKLFDFIPSLLERELTQINYLGPLRDFPHRIYLWSGQKPENVGTRGELTVPALLAAEPEVTEKVAAWLQKLGLVHSFKVRPLAKGRREHEAVVQVFENGPEVLLTEVGFGVSQVLPVLTLCYYVPENTTLIFEQPEIHLHPKIQAGIADLFIEVIKERKLQIILESHSEHFLYRLERRIAEQSFAPAEAALYFCKPDNEGVSHLEELQLDKYGNILNWPENFFGDPLGDKLAQNQAQIKEKLKEKEAAKNGSAGNS